MGHRYNAEDIHTLYEMAVNCLDIIARVGPILRDLLPEAEKVKNFLKGIIDWLEAHPCAVLSIGVTTTTLGIGLCFICPLAGVILTAVGVGITTGVSIALLSIDAHKSLTDYFETIARVARDV